MLLKQGQTLRLRTLLLPWLCAGLSCQAHTAGGIGPDASLRGRDILVATGQPGLSAENWNVDCAGGCAGGVSPKRH